MHLITFRQDILDETLKLAFYVPVKRYTLYLVSVKELVKIYQGQRCSADEPHFAIGITQQSMEWRHSGSPRPKKFRVQKSAGKVLASIFWDQDGILLIDYFPKGQTINAEFYSSLLVQWKDILKESVAEVHQGVLFWHDNAPAHRGLATQKKLAYLGFHCLDHPPHYPDLAPSEYHLFPGLKNNWKVTIFRPTRGSLLPRRPGWTDNLFWIFCEWLRSVLSFVGSILNKSQVWSL